MNATQKTGPGLLVTVAWLLPLLTAGATGYLVLRDHPGEESARIARARDEIRALSSALLAGPALPATADGLAALVAGGRLAHIPDDPWGRPYRYLNPGEQHAWELYSLGPDGVVSQDDVVNWNLYGGR